MAANRAVNIAAVVAAAEAEIAAIAVLAAAAAVAAEADVEIAIADRAANPGTTSREVGANRLPFRRCNRTRKITSPPVR